MSREPADPVAADADDPAEATEAAEDAEVIPQSRRALRQLVKVVFGVAVVVFGAFFVWQRRHDLGDALSRATPGWLVLAFAAAALGQWATVVGFRAVVQSASGQSLPIPEVGRVYFVSQLGKYIPGSVWPIVALTEMFRRHGIGRKTGAIAGLFSLYLSLLSGGLVGVVFICAGAAQHDPALLWLLLVIPPSLLLLRARVINASMAFALRLLRRVPVQLDLGGGLLRRALGWPMLGWLLQGLHCWFLIIALGGPAASSLIPAIGGFALAYTAGTVAIPVPAGAGVREAVLGLALIGVVDQSSAFTHDSVIVVVLLSRGLLVLLDFAQAGFGTLLARYSVPRTAAAHS